MQRYTKFYVGLLIFLVWPCTKTEKVTPPPRATENIKPTSTPTNTPDRVVSDLEKADGEAIQFINDYFAQRAVTCDGSVYWVVKGSRRGTQQLSECKHNAQLEVNGEYFPPKALSESERLNRVDPQPVEWSGVARGNFGTCRISVLGNGEDGSWSNWMDALYVNFQFQKAKGQWKVTYFASDTYDVIFPVNCNFIKDYLKNHPQ